MKLPFLLVWTVAFIFAPDLALSQNLATDKSDGLKKPGSSMEIPREPGWRHPSYRGWESMSVPGLVATYYDLDLDRELDYMVIRKVIRKASAEETTIEEAIEVAKFDDLSVFFSHPVIYFTNRNPLFYCMGVDYRRNCRDIWVDIAEDGLNGNEELYTLSTPSLGVR
ncbi:MAG: hypothetical protein H8E32_02135 [Nitrospinae bacterium]|nr:hypothetical protein [Nitrospinota bacterium]